jgi:hypothetical protein
LKAAGVFRPIVEDTRIMASIQNAGSPIIGFSILLKIILLG